MTIPAILACPICTYDRVMPTWYLFVALRAAVVLLVARGRIDPIRVLGVRFRRILHLRLAIFGLVLPSRCFRGIRGRSLHGWTSDTFLRSSSRSPALGDFKNWIFQRQGEVQNDFSEKSSSHALHVPSGARSGTVTKDTEQIADSDGPKLSNFNSTTVSVAPTWSLGTFCKNLLR
jgi:hypothetical protein